MKVIIAGSRDIDDYKLVEEAMWNSGFEASEIVSGGARGVDFLGEEYARKNNISLRVFNANWNLYGKPAGMFRNMDMSEHADALLAVWDGTSKGTKNMIETMRKLKKPIYVKYV